LTAFYCGTWAGGSGYAIGNILEVEGGTATQKAKVAVATLSGSAVATVTVQDGGGAYSSAPGLTGASTNNDPGTGTGAGCTLDLTMTGLIGTTGISATGGTGSGATFNLTLTDTGWTALRDWNNYSYNSLTDEREVVIQGDAGSGADPIVGCRSYSDVEGVDSRYGLVMFGMTAFNSGIQLADQPNIGKAIVPSTTNASHLLCFNTSQSAWLSVTGRKIGGVVKCQGSSILAYQPFYLGLMNPYGTVTENPYPMLISGTSGKSNVAPDAGTIYVSSFLNPINVSAGQSSGIWYFQVSTLSWLEVANGFAGTGARQYHTVYPTGEPYEYTNSIYGCADLGAFAFFDGICLHTNQPATRLLYPPPGGTDQFLLIPCCLINTASSGSVDPTDDIHAELDNLFWFSNTKTDGSSITAEDTITVGTDRYRVFTDTHNTRRYSYFAMKET